MVLLLGGIGFFMSFMGCAGSPISESGLVDIMSCAFRDVDHMVTGNDNFWQAISVFMFQGECTVNLNNLFSKPSTPNLTWTNPRQSFLGNYDYASHFTYDNSSVSVRFHFLVCCSITFRCCWQGEYAVYTSERHTWIDSVLFLESV